MTGADTYLTHTSAGLFIFPIYLLHYIIVDYSRAYRKLFLGKRHDPGQIKYLTQKTEDNTIVEDKN